MKSLFVFLAIILFIQSHQLKKKHYYVFPTDGRQKCPQKEDCHPLSYYTNNALDSFQETGLIFPNGEHFLDKEIALIGYNTLLIFGLMYDFNIGPNNSTMQSSVIIRCTDDSIIAFNIISTQILMLKGLTVSGCKTAFSVHNVTELSIKQISIQNSTSVGLSWQFNNDINEENATVNVIDSSFYSNCRHPPPVNGDETGCSHLILIMNQISFASYGIMYSNFSDGSNMLAGVYIVIPEKNETNNIEGELMLTVYRCLFLKNTGTKCGGLFLKSSNYLDVSISISNSEFLYNKMNISKDIGVYSSGGMTMIVGLHNGNIEIYKCLFQGNSGGGALISYFVVKEINTHAITIAVFNSIFRNNSGRVGAGLKILVPDQDGSRVLIVNTSVTSNYYEIEKADFGALYFFCFLPFVPIWLESVTVSHNNVTGIFASNCQLLVTGDTSIIADNTSPYFGGGLVLGDHSLIYSIHSGKIAFSNNRAGQYGGAIYSDANPFPKNLQEEIIYSWLGCSFSALDAFFVNNSAGLAGNDIFGGQFYACNSNPIYSPFNTSNKYYNGSFYFCNNESFPVLHHIKKPISSLVSSNPLGVCLCNDNYDIADCAKRSISKEVYPGGKLILPLATVGMCAGITPGAIVIKTYNINVTLGNADQLTKTWVCKNYSYILQQISLDTPTGHFIIEPSDMTSRNSTIRVAITFFDCPPGLCLLSSGSCDCNPIVSLIHNVKCNISWIGAPIKRSGNVWLKYDNQYNCTIANMVCPFDYCNTSVVYLNIDDPDIQCTLNRSGILCGQCQAGLSLMLGSNRCHSCGNNLLLIVAFILIGMALVAFLLACNLTVSMGSINAVLFYSNVFKLNEVVFFPDSVKIPVLSHFIAWFNLDLGIEICFFHGLDGYWKTWLQYVFPIYIWLLVGAIIIGSHYSGRLSRVFGNNTVPVLATLILMSYSKLLRTITNALMVSMIKCDEKEWSLWSVDANIVYLSHKHSYLVAGSLLFFLVSIFYGGMIFSSQWLQKCTGKYCKASHDPVVKLKPLVDSYTGPYKDKYRFWTGLLIFVRVVLTAVFSYTTQMMPGINNYIIMVVCVLLIRVSANGIYRNKALNYLEFSHYFNLFCVSLSSELIYHLQWDSHRVYLSSASVSISMVLFIGTVLVHIHIKLEKKCGKFLCFEKFCSATNEDNDPLQETDEMNNAEDGDLSPARIIQRRESIIFDFNIRR